MKEPLCIFVVLLLVGCTSAEEPSPPPTQSSTPSVSPSSSESQTVRPALSVSDPATCQTLFGSEDNIVSDAASFLTDLDNVDEGTVDEAELIEISLSSIASSASEDLSDLINVMNEPFTDLLQAVNDGEADYHFDANRFKAAANEVIRICDPLLESDPGSSPEGSEADGTEDPEASLEPIADESAEEAQEDSSLEKESISQTNALETAQSYLAYTAFSKSGLVDQLIYEKFSRADSEWAVNQLEIDWNEQAAKMAKQYLDYSSFSRQGLIDQLKYEGFSTKQARYGVDQVGL